jgi:hypothetical protein
MNQMALLTVDNAKLILAFQWMKKVENLEFQMLHVIFW